MNGMTPAMAAEMDTGVEKSVLASVRSPLRFHKSVFYPAALL